MTALHDRLAAFYARTAIAESQQIEVQHAANARRAAFDGYRIPDDPEFRFSDRGVTGLRNDRPELGRLVSRLVDGQAQFGRLYIADPSRLGRSSAPSMWWGIEYLLRRHQVEVVYLSANQHHSSAARGGCG